MLRLQLKAGLDGLGVVWLPKMMVEAEIEKGNFVRVLEDWDISYSGYYMYYPSRRESSPLFRLLIDTLRLSNS